MEKSKKVKDESLPRKPQYIIFESAKGNQVWTASLPLAWREMVTLGEGAYHFVLEEKDFSARETVNKFKDSPGTFEDADEESMYFKAGFQTDASKAINNELKDKFPRKKLCVDPIKNDQVVFYGTTQKLIKLKSAFFHEPESSKYMFFEGKRVVCYQTASPDQRQQIHILKYTDSENFLLRVDTSDPGDSLFLLRTKEKLQIDQAIEIVLKSENDKGTQMGEKDVFKIPRIRLSFSRFLTELVGHKIVIKGKRKYEIAEFFEDISLSFENTPIKMQSGGNIYLSVGEQSQPILKPKYLTFSRGFWLIMKRKKGTHPYLAIFVMKPQEFV